MKQLPIALISIATLMTAQADELKITQFRHVAAPLPTPIAIGDTTQLKANAIESYLPPLALCGEQITIGDVAPGNDEQVQIHALGFKFENRDFCKAEINIDGLSEFEATVDGKQVGGAPMAFTPGTHEGVIKYVSRPGRTDSLEVTVSAPESIEIKQIADNSRIMTLEDVMYGTRISHASVSPDGLYIIADYADTGESGKTTHWQRLYDIKNKKWLHRLSEHASWMPNGHNYYVEREDHHDGTSLVVIDAATGDEQVKARHLPEGRFMVAPNEQYLVYSLTRKGEGEDPGVYQVLQPDDRQPGWRDRQYPAIYPLDGRSALMPLTTGSTNCYAVDISQDGNKMLLMTSKNRMGKRPTTVFSVMVLDVPSMHVDTLVCDDGFIMEAYFSPDAKQVLVKGTPEAFDRIGCVLTEDAIPSMIQCELFVVDVATKQVSPITTSFDPNPEAVAWSKADGKIYVQAENRDLNSMYRIDPQTGKYEDLGVPEDYVKGFNVADSSTVMACWGQSDSSPDALYLIDKKGNAEMLDRPSAARLEGVKMANVQDWNYVNSNGDTIYGRYYLPDNFDPSYKYPMIVYYYGGCSPSSRTFESRYPCHVYSQQGYVMYVVQPSGATGFGQEFSSRHVNTAGNGPAQDIIEGTKRFVAEHDFVDSSKIGCIGASYGGFMTQYLQTVTDIFAAAVSHAGISDHTSYWGEGYWGYSYSEVSMAESYPWTRHDLYVDHSPLFNAHKVKTPILFVHGDADNNVPVGESIQMFTALKLLGVPTAMVLVKGQDHHILDFDKRKRWQDTIFAWFAKYLKDDSTWWDHMYPAKGLND